MSRNALDRRVQKTRKLLQTALIELMAEEDYQSITVRKILDRANVGRSTFYAHFGDKDQLLHSCLESLSALFAQHAMRLSAMKKEPGGENNTLPQSLFQFAAQNQLFFKALLRRKRDDLFPKIIYDSMVAQTLEHIGPLMPPEKHDSLQSEMIAHYIAGAVMGVLAWWVEKDMPYPAEEMGSLVRRIALPGFREVLGSMSG